MNMDAGAAVIMVAHIISAIIMMKRGAILMIVMMVTVMRMVVITRLMNMNERAGERADGRSISRAEAWCERKRQRHHPDQGNRASARSF